MARVSLDVVPAFELRQYVFEDLPWRAVETDLDEILAGGYSVSLFTTWTEPGIEQVWVKTTDELHPQSYFGALPATVPRNPVPGRAARQLHATARRSGSFGRAPAALPARVHAEQRRRAPIGIRRPARARCRRPAGVARASGAIVSPLLLISEIRTIAADTLWLSPFYEQDSIAFHFTWKPLGDEVLAVLPLIEAALAPFGVRPHWGKLFTLSPQALEAVYPKLPAFRELRRRLDPDGKFQNAFVARYISGDESVQPGT